MFRQLIIGFCIITHVVLHADNGSVAQSLYAKVHTKQGCFLVYKGAVSDEGNHKGILWCRWWQKVEFFNHKNKLLKKESLTNEDALDRNALLARIQDRLAEKGRAVQVLFYPHKGPLHQCLIVYNKRGHYVAHLKKDKASQAPSLRDGQLLPQESVEKLSNLVSNAADLAKIKIKRGAYIMHTTRLVDI